MEWNATNRQTAATAIIRRARIGEVPCKQPANQGGTVATGAILAKPSVED
jgi:hypothetical protein